MRIIIIIIIMLSAIQKYTSIYPRRFCDSGKYPTLDLAANQENYLSLKDKSIALYYCATCGDFKSKNRFEKILSCCIVCRGVVCKKCQKNGKGVCSTSGMAHVFDCDFGRYNLQPWAKCALHPTDEAIPFNAWSDCNDQGHGWQYSAYDSAVVCPKCLPRSLKALGVMLYMKKHAPMDEFKECLKTFGERQMEIENSRIPFGLSSKSAKSYRITWTLFMGYTGSKLETIDDEDMEQMVSQAISHEKDEDEKDDEKSEDMDDDDDDDSGDENDWPSYFENLEEGVKKKARLLE